MMNLGRIHEAIAEVIPDRECLVFRDKHFSWREIRDRTRRLANLLRSHGLGCHTPRADLERWESGQDHVAIYALNGNEYLEGMVGCYKARCAPFNVNYRYVEEELLYLLADAKARALVYAAEFAPNVQAIRGRLPDLEVLIQVADDSGNELLPDAVDYESITATPQPAGGMPTPSGDDLYILYTGGTTGMPLSLIHI